MLIDYPDHRKYFEGNPSSISTIMVGKSKRKLSPIKITIWPMVHKYEDAEIDNVIRSISYTYMAIELSGAIEYKDIIEGFSDFEALTSLIVCIQYQLSQYEVESGNNYYINNYAGQEWCKASLSEVFGGLVQDDEL